MPIATVQPLVVPSGWQDAVIPGQDWVWAHHAAAQDLTGLYGEITYTLPDSSTIVQPAADIVQVPAGFVYAYDEVGRMLDPRRFAGEGGTPIGGTRTALPPGARSSPPTIPRRAPIK